MEETQGAENRQELGVQVGIKDFERTYEDNIIFSFVMIGGPVQIYLVHGGNCDGVLLGGK